jgi:multiple sugar transport system substrate-binding protein
MTASFRRPAGLRVAIGLLVLAAPAWWLFGDTLRYHWPTRFEDNAVRFAHWGGYGEYLMWQQIIAAFQRQHPEVDIRQEYVVGVRYETKIQQQLVAGNAPDVIMFQDEPFPNFAPKGFADLGDLIRRDGIDLERDYFDTAVESFTVDGRVRGMPLFGGNVLIYCNKLCFERASRFHGRPISLPPDDWTLEQFVEVARDLTFDEDGDGRIDQFGFALPTWLYYLPFLWAEGARVLDATRTHWAMVGPEAEAAWQFYCDLRFRYHVSPLPVEQAEMNTDTAFFTGRVAMCVNGPWMQPFLAGTTLRDNYLVVHSPRGPGGRATRVTWDALAIHDRISPQKTEAAWKFVKFACGPPGQEFVARYQRSVPALRSAAEAFKRYDRDVGSRKFVDALEYARLQPITVHWNEMDRTISRHMSDLLNELGPRQTPAEFLASLANDPVIRRCFGGEQ